MGALGRRRHWREGGRKHGRRTILLGRGEMVVEVPAWAERVVQRILYSELTGGRGDVFEIRVVPRWQFGQDIRNERD